MKKTIIDIAKELNVAPSTVSKAVNNKGRMSAETRQRILDYVDKSGYVAMSNARRLSSKKSWTIGIVLADISLAGFDHPFFAKIFQSFKTYVEKKGYDTIMLVNKIGNHELSYYDWCINKKIDGVLVVMGNINNENILSVVNSDIPAISTDIILPHLHTIISNDEQGVELAIEYALKTGHQRLAMITGPLSSRAFYQRLQIFKMMLTDKNIDVPPHFLQVSDGFASEDGYEATKRLIQSSTEVPDFIFVTSDVIAFGVIRALEDLGYNVPEHISVLGFDNIDFSRHFEPELSTINQDTKMIAETAAIRLLDMMDHPSEKTQVIEKINVNLIERKSTRTRK